jgi:hypothetical protein
MVLVRLSSLHAEEGPASPQTDGNRQVSVGHERPSCGVVHECILPHLSLFCKVGDFHLRAGESRFRCSLPFVSPFSNDPFGPLVGLAGPECGQVGRLTYGELATWHQGQTTNLTCEEGSAWRQLQVTSLTYEEWSAWREGQVTNLTYGVQSAKRQTGVLTCGV